MRRVIATVLITAFFLFQVVALPQPGRVLAKEITPTISPNTIIKLDQMQKSTQPVVKATKPNQVANPAWLSVRIKTGGDDLRQRSMATLSINNAPISSKDRCGSFDLNNGSNWPNDSVNSKNIKLCQEKVKITSTCLHFKSGGKSSISGDNWNVDAVKIDYINSRGMRTAIVDESGSPLVRFTARRTVEYCFPVFLPADRL